MRAYKKKAVFVLGMHRSGTSALTAGLQYVLRVSLGPIENKGSKENPKGFFENSKIVRFNDRLLQRCEAGWDTYGSGKRINFSAPFWDSSKLEALQLLQDFYGTQDIWAIKDPRISVLMPFWDAVTCDFGARVYRILIVRNPLEVAHSQCVRHRTSPETSDVHLSGEELRYTLNLWFWYNLVALSNLPDDSNIIVGYDQLLSDPKNVLRAIGKLLGLSPDPTGLDEYCTSFLDKNLKRHTVEKADIDAYTTDYPYVFDLYNLLRKPAAGCWLRKKTAQKLIAAQPQIAFLNSWTGPIYGYIAVQRSRLNDRLKEIASNKETIASLRKELEQLKQSLVSKEEPVHDGAALLNDGKIV
ncbi:MAG: sulfotransferase domain-containing protein [Planctomycetaceae bacterium]|nr:sulfotransferase domain-containing protein [Planctomycetaceae bacterium]